MAKKKKIEANVETTPLEVPETMKIESEPKEPNEEQPVFKDEIRDAIFAKRRKQLEEEIGLQTGLISTETANEDEPELEPEKIAEASVQEPEKVEEPAVEAESKVEPEPVKEESKAEVIQPQSPEKVKIKVEGKELEVPFETLVTLAQKGMSADQRFQEAARQRQEAEQLMFAVQQNMQPRAAQLNTPQEPESLIPKEKAKELAKRINYGSEEEQAAAFVELGAIIKSQGRSQELPTQELISTATRNAVETIRAEQELETLKKEFPDIVSDVPLSLATDTIARQLAAKYQQEGKQFSRLEVFREAGNMARARYVKAPPLEQTPVQAAPKIVVENEKIERKRAAPKPPATANKVSSDTASVTGVSPSSIVNQMRKARGQPIMI